MGSVWTWLGLGAREPEESSALRDVVNALDRLEPDRARYVARFAYLLGRVAHADQHASAEETSVMERLVRDEGGLTPEQAMLVVSLAKTSNLLFGGTADFEVARDFAAGASYDEKLALTAGVHEGEDDVLERVGSRPGPVGTREPLVGDGDEGVDGGRVRGVLDVGGRGVVERDGVGDDRGDGLDVRRVTAG